MIVTLCAAALCAAACKKADNAAGGGSAASGGSTGATAAGGGGGGGVGGENKLVIGVLSDMSGLYADLAGPGSVVAAQMAVDEVGGKVAGMPIEIVSADHQNKPDIGANLTREWFDTKGVDVIVDVPTSSVALAVSEVTRSKNKVFLVSGAGTSNLTGKACSPNTIHWTYDTWALANAAGREIVKNGGDTWFFLTADYEFGHALDHDVSQVVEASGGKVLGRIMHPLNASDFSSFLVQAQASKAKIIGLANAGGDTINAIKQASEFGIVSKGQKMAGLLVFITDINALGLPTAHGLLLSESFYWDRDDKTREWSQKFAAKHNGAMPTMVQAGVYASLLHFFKAVGELKSAKDGKAVVAKMESMPTDDPLFGKGTIDPNGRTRHPMYVYEVKTPEESKAKWDYYKLVREVPADQAFRAPADSGCPLITK
ncbi:MAG TPA: ABC transporter substrate-binding protein [Kofleriaceae bacterium]|jgi:branched-chain amino acid transport system substrate-binding protein|nr:ABC transporter substrate-binding protein [Kofleriaceae bacterium]